MALRRYRGDGRSPSGDATFPYLADAHLVDAVNMAIALRRPLLVKGPPGCGKTRLAHAIAHELGLDLFEWYVKSTSQAIDGLYTIDVLRRLQDAQRNDPKAQRLRPYIKFGPLGEAIRTNRECVLLIDEIDKADLDFPNDLLREIDTMSFEIEELDPHELNETDQAQGFGKLYQSKTPPIILITSNDEKELPEAFLRRCLFHYIEFPDRDRLLAIIDANAGHLNVRRELVENAVARLVEFRRLGGFRKAPSTSELLDWVRILAHWDVQPEQLAESVRLTDIPHWEKLFKHQQDVQSVARQSAAGAGA
jgi:MoxR-like ATPase